MSYRWRWTILMTAAGLLTALAVYALTGSLGWALAGLLASGVVINAVAGAGRGAGAGRR